MTTIREKYLEKIKEDFEVLSTIVLQQMELVITATHDNKDGKLYTKIEHNEVIIDGLEVKIRDEVINSIVLYCPRASDCRKIMSYHDMTAYLERIGDLLLNIADFLREVELQGTLSTSGGAHDSRDFLFCNICANFFYRVFSRGVRNGNFFKL